MNITNRVPHTHRRVLAALLCAFGAAAFAVAVLVGSALAAGNLVINGSFENDSNGDGIPNNWTPLSLTPSDKRVCNKAHAGTCSFKMIGEGVTKYMFQFPAISGGAGDSYTLKVWVMTKDLVWGTGNATIYLETHQTDGGYDSDGQNLAQGTSAGWVLYTLNVTSTETYDSVRVWIKFYPESGKAWFDKVKLVEVP
jgi:hypothetical protein